MNIDLFKKIYSVHILGSLFLIFLSGASPITAQNFLHSNFTQEELIISINNIAIDGELTLRDLVADFPYPILSTISVVDTQANVIIGLADTLRWLGPNDIAEIGLRISEIWQPLLEYHQENPSIPGEPDLTNQSPSPIFTEVRKSELLPTSTMLVMDVSSSMQDELEDAKVGARLYIELLRSVDRGGLVQFSGNVVKYLAMTNDTTLLIEAINDATMSLGTAIYDATMAAIEGIKLESGRRGIILYTDGQDNSSDITSEAVIERARNYNLPIYTIALGNKTHEAVLRQIADQTGGIFFKAATAEAMKIIYTKLSLLMQNYYVMAHASPDTASNNTWRTVDITVNIPSQKGRGMGQYFVSGFHRPSAPELAVNLSAHTDTTVVVSGDTIHAIQPGEIYTYIITIKNLGSSQADSVKLVQLLPDSVHSIVASISPQISDRDSLVWFIHELKPNGEVSISVSVQLAEELPRELTELISQVKLFTAYDPVLTNNFDTETVKVLFQEPPQDWQAFIEATPPIVEVGDKVTVKVQVSGPIDFWDLWVYFPDDQIDSTYADEFIASTQLTPHIWFEVEPKVTITQMSAQSKQRQIIFELRAIDAFGNFKHASTSVTLQSEADLNVDRNIFIPDQENNLGINFRLGSDSEARLEIYDITGTKITKLTEALFKSGWNTYYWNGLTEEGQKIGSGFYIITLRANGYYAWKKLMIVR